MNIWEGHPLVLIYHFQFHITFHWPVSFCGSNSGISVITIASNVGICALDVVVSDNKVAITGKMILCWSCVINIFFKYILYIIHLLNMLYSSNLSLCESSGKIIECTLLLLWHYPSLNLPAWYIQIGGKTTIPVLVLPWGIFHIFTSGRYCMVRAVRSNQDSLWNVNGTLWYLTLMPGAVSLSDQERRLHESSYLYRESSGQALFANC